MTNCDYSKIWFPKIESHLEVCTYALFLLLHACKHFTLFSACYLSALIYSFSFLFILLILSIIFYHYYFALIILHSRLTLIPICDHSWIGSTTTEIIQWYPHIKSTAPALPTHAIHPTD